MHLTSYLQDRTLTVALTGEIDHHTARDIIQTMDAKLRTYLPASCILDYGEVTFMDSSGIAVILFTLRRMRELAGDLVLQNIAQQPMKVINAAGVDRLVKIKEGCAG